jgi:hypothetical protein
MEVVEGCSTVTWWICTNEESSVCHLVVRAKGGVGGDGQNGIQAMRGGGWSLEQTRWQLFADVCLLWPGRL